MRKEGGKREISIEESPLGALLEVHMQLQERIFSSTNILLTISSIILSVIVGFFFTKFISLQILSEIAVSTLILSALISMVLCLFIIRPELKHKEGETEFYFLDVFHKFNKKQYEQRLYQILSRDKSIIKLFVDEFYELGEKVLLPNFKKIRLATEILITGAILSVILFILSFIFPTI